ncbi:aldo/keto reductase [Pseudoprimorskyibacter insulae]|uniref:D-threo-aldose 1-dehydrogenase n=1 Tax=Pseudoprimorskyibacter insulae TaxID=1695997 RepID=A0A2R8AY90_9RHOB|nr:aldo/keto reductase [Pseudoprimorskyibacter insulae]SPF80996.1 D-threo-aldose 1-dehydrogenase [Pseudoprimorskyibacter insulae]
MHRYSLGLTDLEVTEICFGASGLGNMPDTYGYSVDEDRARATVRAVFDGPVNFLDTSNNYGFGRSEERIGAVIRERGGLPEGFVLSTKLDRDMKTGRFDAARVRQSVEESLTRLGLTSIPLLHLHDPEHARDLSEITQEGGALDELFKLKDEGVAQAVGLAMGRLDIMEPIVRDCPFDAIISHNRFSLLNRSASGLFDYCYDNDIAVLNAAPFAGGVLAKGSAEMPRVTYQEADDATLAPVRAVEAICAQYGIPPLVAALQFSLRDPRITSTIVGVSKPERVAQTLEAAKARVPEMVWDALMALPFAPEDPEANRVYKPDADGA